LPPPTSLSSRTHPSQKPDHASNSPQTREVGSQP
jgi:hypothetical protein